MDHLWTPWRYAYVTNQDTRNARAGVPPALAAWPGDHHCVFCNLIAAADHAIEHGMPAEEADQAAKIVLRGKTCYVCLNAYPYSSGHVMIVPYVHEGSLGKLAPEIAQEMMMLTQRSTLAQERAYSPDGTNIGLNVGTAAGAGVAGHLHMHVLPRWLGDTNFMTVTAETRVLPEMLDETWLRLRAAFAAI